MTDHDEETSSCTLCGGALYLLGQLGRLIHTRCRNCGMQFSQEEEA